MKVTSWSPTDDLFSSNWTDCGSVGGFVGSVGMEIFFFFYMLRNDFVVLLTSEFTLVGVY